MFMTCDYGKIHKLERLFVEMKCSQSLRRLMLILMDISLYFDCCDIIYDANGFN